jgi:hypothetical protein
MGSHYSWFEQAMKELEHLSDLAGGNIAFSANADGFTV